MGSTTFTSGLENYRPLFAPRLWRCRYATYAVGKARASSGQVTRSEKRYGNENAWDSVARRVEIGVGIMKKFLLATVSMVALTSVARAADMPATMPATMPTKERMYSPAPVASWDGAYIGVQGGVARRDTLVKFEPTLSNFQLQDARDLSQSGGTAGVLLGYNWQQGNFVYGVEGDWSWVGAKRNWNTPVEGVSDSSDVAWLATIRGRAGLAFESTLFYLTGGAAFGHVNNSVATVFGGVASTSFTQDQTKAGWTLGAGAEHMFAPNWTARAELRYVDLGKTSVECVAGVGRCPNADRGTEFSNSLWMGQIGLSYKFGGGSGSDWSRAQAYAPPAVSSWAGGYLGIEGGAAQNYALFGDSDCFFSGCPLIDHRKTGGTVGGLLGYNWQQGSFVYGVEGDWGWIGAKTSRSAPGPGLAGNNNLSTSYDVNWLATLRGRAGLAFDSTLFYVTGGAAFGHAKNSVELISADPADTGTIEASYAQNQTKVGWTAGVGAEYMLSQHWTARAEFRYVDLGRTTVACSSANNFNGCVSTGYRGEFSNTLKLGLVGLNYKF
jgi:outer membrane immunogenic protein